MATATKVQPQSQEWRERAMVIAERDDLRATYVSAAYAELDEEGNRRDRHEFWDVPSRSHPGEPRRVTHRERTGELVCTCEAGRLGGLPCSHMGAVAWHLALYERNVLRWRRAAGFAVPLSENEGDELLPPAA